MNWRKPITITAFLGTRPSALAHYRRIRNLETASRETVEQYQKERLNDLLKHAHETVPYYREVLDEAGVVDDGDICLDNFSNIPLLTKEDLRTRDDDLKSSAPGEGVFRNTSGGTTGEPVDFLQDDTYLRWNNATEFYYQLLAGRDFGEPWVKLWGDESEIFGEEAPLKKRLSDFVRNRHVLNTYQMGDKEMDAYVQRINDIQPASIEAYVESIDELGKHIEKKGLDIYSPNGILSTAGTLDENIRERVERVFDTTVLDKYGSREVGNVACECRHQEGLHVFDYTHYVEVVNEAGDPLPPGEEGELAITVLTNYTMPLIRYRIGDMGIMKGESCTCGRPFSMLKDITGRVSDHFVTLDGKLVYGALFRHLMFHRPWVEKFQVHQTARDHVVYYIVPGKGEPSQEGMEEIERQTKVALGGDVAVEFEFVEEIEPSESGKYRYTISDVSK